MRLVPPSAIEPTPGAVPAASTSLPSRKRLLVAARELFATGGYEGTTTAMIARGAGTSESQLVKHFGSKHGVLEALFDEWWQRVFDRIGEDDFGSKPPEVRLDNLIGLLLEEFRRDPMAARLLLFEGRRRRRGSDELMISQGFHELARLLDELFEELEESGRLAVPVQAARAVVIGSFEGLMRDRHVADLVAEYQAGYDEAAAHSVFRRVLAALVSPGEP